MEEFKNCLIALMERHCVELKYNVVDNGGYSNEQEFYFEGMMSDGSERVITIEALHDEINGVSR